MAVFFPALVLFFLALTPLHAAATEYNCSSCSDCSTKIQAASPGDIVNLNTSINSSSCIQFSSASSVTFDCNNFNITGAGSGGTGIYIRDRYNIIRNCYLSLFERGIYLSYSQFSPDGYNLITNNTLFNNTNGIYILSMSAYDTFTNNKFYNNTYAIYIWLSNQGYGENYFYNNIFSNNTYHFENNYYDIHNYFNTTLNCSAGPNIIGGDCIGGNYWTSPSGNFSDTCTDLFAPYGICDDIHSMGSFWQDGFDYLPLVQRYTYPCDSCSDCSTKIQAASPGDAFYLNTTITNHSGNCIEFGGADGVTFRCDVPLIEGDGDSDGYGIFLSDSSVNNTIMGCSNISLFSIGVFVNQSDNNTIINVTANENIGYGMKIEANNITIMDCNTTNNDHPTLDSAYGIYMIGNYNKIDNTYSEGNDGTDAVSPTSYGIWFSGNYSEIVDIVTKNNEPAGGTSSLGYGIYLEHSNNNTIADIVSLNSSYAHLYLNYSDNNTIYSITANYSGENGVGVYSYSSDWNNFTDITSSYHGNIGLGAGFYFDGCSNNIINYLISTDNSGYGIQFANSHNNTIVNSTLSSNSKEAIMLLSCSDNNISSTTMSDNLFGITFYSQNSNNIISNSNIKNSTSYGIYFYENGTGVSSNNFIYNNLFNNTINVYSNNESAFNYFNTTLDYFNSQSAINGSCLGGNFWTGPNGNFSDNCTDTASDGICDSDYTLQTNITDYLPLTIQRNYICNSCSRCSSMVQWASSYGGLVNLNATITNQSGTCISSTYANNVIFDCNGFVISGDSVGYDYGFYFDNYYDRHNLTIRNCPNISYFYSGISIGLRLIDYINISNVSLYNNSHGIYIDCKSQLYSPLFVENIHASNNGLSGFRTSQCSGMRITDSVFDNNEKGMEFGYINDNSTISNITVTNNSDTGIYLRCADNNTFTDSRILNNTYGVKFVSCGAYSDINTFYNNIFNNTINVLDYYNSNHTNYFNTTLNCSAGSNIIGGDCVGGNFWTDSDGNFSDTCSDDNSPYGICDSSYTPQTNNTDYLPLMQEYVTSCQDCSDCSTKIQAASPGDIVYLNTSITGQSGSCIEFSDADGVIFDCNGLVINGDNSGFDYGIDTSSNSDNNTIRNCPNISGFA
ncbi:MAG: right-handed parallel beta-helix repeat-containing protein, partial [Candidatus Peribacteraceae bacterium]|nr:right-handed parallel beta-helix repeat-containing protein [Candidatus Peribacteraceae bacterium]